MCMQRQPVWPPLLLSYLLGAVIVDGGSSDAHRSHDAELTDQYAYAGHEYIIQQTLPGHISRVGSICLRHLGVTPSEAQC